MPRCKRCAPVGVVLGAALWCVGASAAIAADASSEPAGSLMASNASNEGSGALQEVVVTARRREEDLQQVPISIESLGAEDLAVRNITTTEALNHAIIDFAPAPSTFFGLEQSGVRIRGLPNVGVYIDGVAHQEGFGFLGDLVEMDRVEVLRGPQGTLFGKNSLAGAVQYVTAEPADHFRLNSSVTVGDYSRFNVQAAADLPLGDGIFTKLTVAHDTRAGYLPSTSVNADFGSEDNTIARADVLFRPNDKFNWRFILEQDNIGTNGNASTLQNLSFSCAPIPAAGNNPGPACTYNGAATHGAPQLAVPTSVVYAASEEWKTASNYQGPEMFTDSTNYTTIANLEFNSNWALKGIGSYRAVYSEHFEDFASVGVDMFEGENTNVIFETTGEGQLLFNSDTVSGTTGVYYYNDYHRYRRNNWFNNELKLSVNPADNAAANASIGLPAGTVKQFGPPDPDQLTYYRIHGIAGYTEWTWKPLTGLSLTAGVRWNKDYNDTRAYTPANPIPNACCIPSTSFAPGPLLSDVNLSFTNTSPRFSAQYNWTPSVMTYATYSEGFNQGGGTQVGQGSTFAILPYSPETLRNYELGLRSEFLDKTLLFNASAFYNNYDNVQVTEDIDFNSVTANGGKGVARGVEVESQWVASRQFSLNLGLGYLKSQLTVVPSSSGITSGTPFPYAPKESATLGAQYQFPLDQGASLTVRADEGWTSWANTGVDSSSIYIPSYGLLSASLIYQPSDQHWNARLYGTNLTDKYYVLGGYNIPPLGNLSAATVGIRRMFGVQFTYLLK
jgi:iron complex outermembrane receptor protein